MFEQTFLHLYYEVFDSAMSNNTSFLVSIRTNKGGLQLVLDGFIFKLNKRTSAKLYWKYTVVNCTAHIYTDINNNLLNKTGDHNHLVELENLKVKQFRTVRKARVINETIPIQKIYDDEIIKANFSLEILAPVSLPYHIRMNKTTEFSNIFLYVFI